MRSLTAANIDFIKSFEGLRLSPYPDVSGRWTIGYGHTQGVNARTPSITQAEANALLLKDLQQAKKSVETFISVPLTDNQYAALVSLVYNTGASPLQKTLGAKLNASLYFDAANEFEKWIYSDNQISPGLVRRRAAEKALFMGGH